MKARQLRPFLEEFLASQGAATERRGDNLLVVRPPRKMVPVIGSRELVLAFNLRGVQEDPRSELGTVGNPVFDRILELAREAGRAGERFEPAGAVPKKLPQPEEHFTFVGSGVRIGSAAPTYTPLYFLLFRIEYSLEDVADELEVVPVDSITRHTLPQTPELSDYWEGLQPEPDSDRAPQAAFPVPEEIIRTSLRLLEKRLRKRLAKVRRESDEHLARETGSIERYYRQLVEETRNAGRRWALPASHREERIRLLQLDWKRRVEEAQLYWRPQLDIRLAAVAASQRPRIGFPVLRASARTTRKSAGHRPPMVFWDEADKQFVDPPCVRCGAPDQTQLAPADGGFLCPRCERLVEEGGYRPTRQRRTESEQEGRGRGESRGAGGDRVPATER